METGIRRYHLSNFSALFQMQAHRVGLYSNALYQVLVEELWHDVIHTYEKTNGRLITTM